MTSPISVRGGAGGVEAHYDDMTAAARLFGRAADDTGEQALRLSGYLVHPDVLASAVLDPAGAAEFEGRLLAALDGPSGLTWLAARCAGIDVGLRGAAVAYLGADRLDAQIAPEIEALGHAPQALGDGAAALAGGDPSGALQKMITDDPALADLGVDTAAVLLGSGSVAAGTRLLERPFDDGEPRVTALGADPIADAAGPPRSLAAVLGGLARRDRGRSGEVDVRFLDGAAGRKVIVDVPGTKDWSLALQNDDVTSLATNLRALSGEVTTYERGIVEAMRRAGVRADDEVMLVGHSEGGMVAVNAARHLAARFHISHVITAGAPVGLVAGGISHGVDVLVLENQGDVVPHLDGAGNPDRVNVTTVTTHRNHGDIGDNHDLAASYVPGAADIDASDDPSARAYLAGLGGFLCARTVRTETFRITRMYP